jgi:hypothetical protein
VTTGPAFSWVVDSGPDRSRLTGIPLSGVSYRPPPARPSLQLRDAQGRFCQMSGLFPRVFLDLPATSCENNCNLGIFVPRSANLLSIGRMPALNRAGGTFDVLVETRLGCMSGEQPVQLRFPSAVTYTACVGDCDSDGSTEVHELVLGVGQALGQQSLGECAAHDTSGDGTVMIHELIAAVNAALEGCGAPPAL